MTALALIGGPALAADLKDRTGQWPRVTVADAADVVRRVLDSGRWAGCTPTRTPSSSSGPSRRFSRRARA